MIPLARERSAFGRHETFPLRFGWLTKGYQAWIENPGIFERDDATIRLGVGKNMVAAIKYWMLAAQVATSGQRDFQVSSLGQMIFDREEGHDPYLEDDATIWLLHWLLASNAHNATGLFWFFNRFHKPEFTGDELNHALRAFIRENLDARVSDSTLKHDTALLVRMYEPSVASKSTPLEEGLDSPMATLGLIQALPGTKYHESKPEFRAQLPLAVLGFAVAQVFAATGATQLPIEQLIRGDGRLAAPGSVFRLTEECLVAKLEEMIVGYPGLYKLSESAGIHQIFQMTREPVDPFEFLNRHYGAKQ